ncbi:hypothetical protein RvY_08030 [Ramazzottius varieornatus]|uniref:dipeptidase E n=1 Tax=Ramazzottius varieornatus TaxID=947166 RepID=A0A1D1VCJ9_RAMVA|nr:hypothetical protein RvY_08030 [Ramazzottius varieornatus]
MLHALRRGRATMAKDLMSASPRRLLLLSSASVHGCEPFEYAKEEIINFFGSSVKEILFIPYALHDYDAYVSRIRQRFAKIGLDYKIVGIHEGTFATEAVNNAQAVFIGGGNSFRLLKSLYAMDLVPLLQKRVLEDGLPYMGSSAGSNVATISINTTNDMPIVYPPTFQALNLIPININPHYIDTDPNSTHKGETRDERIAEYLEQEPGRLVLALREGAWLRVEGDRATVGGKTGARLFKSLERDQGIVEIAPDADVSYLMEGLTRTHSIPSGDKDKA